MNIILVYAAAGTALLGTTAIAGSTIDAGLYEVTTKSSLQSSTITEESCISPSAAAQDGIGLDLPASCHWVRQGRAGGRLDLVGECGGGAGMTLTGTYTPDSYDYVLATTGGPLGNMTARVQGQKIAAECEADEE